MAECNSNSPQIPLHVYEREMQVADEIEAYEAERASEELSEIARAWGLSA